MQCSALCCTVLYCVALRHPGPYSLHHNVFAGALQCVAVCCSVLQVCCRCVASCLPKEPTKHTHTHGTSGLEQKIFYSLRSLAQRGERTTAVPTVIAVCCTLLQSIAICCGVLQWRRSPRSAYCGCSLLPSVAVRCTGKEAAAPTMPITTAPRARTHDACTATRAPPSPYVCTLAAGVNVSKFSSLSLSVKSLS